MKIIDKFRAGQFAVRCFTEEQAKQFVKMCHSNDICWNKPDDAITVFEVYKDETYYVAEESILYYGCIKDNFANKAIVEFETFMNIYIKEEEKKMCSSLNKGIDSKLVQDTYRAVQKPNGSIEFNKVSVVNLCFVKFDGCEKVYAFKNPSDKRLEEGTKVLVDTVHGSSPATVVSSIKIQRKYVKELQYAMTGKRDLKLKKVLGVFETKTVETEVLTKLVNENENN